MSKYRNTGSLAGTVLTDAEATFYAAVDAAEGVRQVAVAAASTPAAVKTANINFHRAVRDAAVAAGNLPHLGGPSRQALFELTGNYV